jgi:HAD superfamily hydrolase (TIGR01459 family)
MQLNPLPLDKISFIPNIAESLVPFENQYDLILVDIWGVTHNGVEPFPHAIEFFHTMKDMGKSLVVLSNAPRLPALARQKLKSMGIDEEYLFDDICTSGLECHLALKNKNDPFYSKLGKRLYHIGPERDQNLYDTLENYEVVQNVDLADFLLITGIDGTHETVDDYLPFLTKAKKRNLPAICANADKVAQFGKLTVTCAGALAEAYAKLFEADALKDSNGFIPNSFIKVHGKPDIGLFEKAHLMGEKQLGRPIAKERILMLGDSLATDIKGANAYGIDSALTLTGVHGNETLDSIHSLFQSYHAVPTYILKDGIR